MAHESHTKATEQLELPVLIFGPVELHRLQRELEALQEFMAQSAIREPGKQPPLPRLSRLLEALAENNNLKLLEEKDRAHLKRFLTDISQNAPVVHVSLAADPSSAFTSKLVDWFRQNIHPYTLLQLGLQPNIAAGCVVRTTNKSFDFSLRSRFFEQRPLLLKAIEGRING
jgi:F0F1-type ATP synthase delta subunit